VLPVSHIELEVATSRQPAVLSAKKGSQRTNDAPDRPRVKDRIFETACDLFYEHGIHAVGVDTIATEAGTNKTSFYRSFATKDDLVAQYLREQVRDYWSFWEATVAPHPGEPRQQIEALFTSYLAPEDPDSRRCNFRRGCPLGNAAVDLAGNEGELQRIIHDYKSEVRTRLRKLARELGARDHAALGDALMLLMEGGYYTRLTFPNKSGPVAAICKAARTLIDAHCEGAPG
jgi:AcrR family transcriptional regulator